MTPLPDPIRLPDAAAADWDDTADVVVVGFGGAGACAAIEAREGGADVVVVERFHGGGATAVSGGIVYAGGGTHVQADAGVEDSVEAMVRYLALEVEDAVSSELLHDFCLSSPGLVRWLADRGVPFEGSPSPIKTSYPSAPYFLYQSGNEGFTPWRDAAPPAARGHRVVGGAFPGDQLFAALATTALRLGVRVRRQTRATRLVIDASGAVVGIEVAEVRAGPNRWLHRLVHRLETAIVKFLPTVARLLRGVVGALEGSSRRLRLRARQGVVLAAGGFVYDRAWLAREAPAYLPGLPLGTAGDDGSGIRLGQSVGGAVSHLDRVSAWRFLYPPHAFAKGILVDGTGQRFVNEFWYGSTIGEAMVEQHAGTATLIIDRALMNEAIAQLRSGELQWFQELLAVTNLTVNCRRAADLPRLAELLDVPPAALRTTIDNYGASARGETDDPFGKDPDGLHELTNGPYYAIDCSIGNRLNVCAVLTLGGLRVDEATGHVLDEDGQPIAGLFAAGRTAAGICARQYVSGLSLADCVYSGRRAGGSASIGLGAERLAVPDPS